MYKKNDVRLILFEFCDLGQPQSSIDGPSPSLTLDLFVSALVISWGRFRGGGHRASIVYFMVWRLPRCLANSNITRNGSDFIGPLATKVEGSERKKCMEEVFIMSSYAFGYGKFLALSVHSSGEICCPPAQKETTGSSSKYRRGFIIEA